MGSGKDLPKAMPKKRRGAKNLPWAWGMAAFCGGMPNAVAGDLLPADPTVWAAAAALSLSLITTVRGSQK
jgi:hypothetical protein